MGGIGLEPTTKIRGKAMSTQERSIFMATKSERGSIPDEMMGWLDACPVLLSDENRAAIISHLRNHLTSSQVNQLAMLLSDTSNEACNPKVSDD